MASRQSIIDIAKRNPAIEMIWRAYKEGYISESHIRPLVGAKARFSDITVAVILNRIWKAILKESDELQVILRFNPNSVRRFQDLGQGYSLDLRARVVRGPKGPIPLETKEYGILALLVTNPTLSFALGDLKDQLWESPRGVSDSSVKVALAKLRKKLPGPTAGRNHWLIRTVPSDSGESRLRLAFKETVP